MSELLVPCIFDLSGNCSHKCENIDGSIEYIDFYGDEERFVSFDEKARDAKEGFPDDREAKALEILKRMKEFECLGIWYEDCALFQKAQDSASIHETD